MEHQDRAIVPFWKNIFDHISPEEFDKLNEKMQIR
jgi:hypothetical protein